MSVRSLRSRLGALVRRAISARDRVGSVVDVVVVVERVDLPRLAAALGSVADQRQEGMAVWICPVADAEPSVADAARVLPAQPTWQRAADAGVAAGRGEFVILLRGCDLLAPDAIRLGLATLTASGSVLCAGRVDQSGEPEQWLLAAQRRGHAVARLAHPSGGGGRLPVDLTLVGTMVRRSAWTGLDADEDWLLSASVARLLAGAGTKDVLVEPTYTWFPEHGTRAYGATPSVLPGLSGRRDRLDEIGAILATDALAERWRRTRAGFEVPRLLQDAERADDEQWQTLRELAVAATDGPRWSNGVGAAARVLLWLAAQGRRADLGAVAAEIAALGVDLRTLRKGAAVLAEWSIGDLPDEVRELPASETTLLTRVSRVDPPGPERRAELLLAIDHLDLADPMTRIVVHDGRGRVVDTAPIPATEATRWLGRRFQAATAVSVLVPGIAGRATAGDGLGRRARSAPVACTCRRGSRRRPGRSGSRTCRSMGEPWW